MTSTSKYISAFVIAAILSLVACGPTYVVQPNGQAAAYQTYDPGYNPDQFAYDAVLAAAIVGGVNGYYGPGHIFYPSVMVGGVGGYYDRDHHFHTSVTNRTVVVNNYNTGRDNFVKTHPVNTAKPNFGGGAGSITKGGSPSPTADSAKPNFGGGAGAITKGGGPTQTAKPNFGSNAGTVTRTQATTTTTTTSKPNFGSGSGAASRPASASASRPNFGKK